MAHYFQIGINFVPKDVLKSKVSHRLRDTEKTS
jgi:hypothetical protein